MKESENVSVTALCALDPFDDESPEDKITCEEEKKTEAESQAAEGTISSCSVGGESYEELAVGDIHVFPKTNIHL